MSELPSRRAVLPAEFEILKLGLLVALLESGERSSVRAIGREKLRGERGYLAESGRNLRLGGPNPVGLIYRGSLLAACLSTIVMGAVS